MTTPSAPNVTIDIVSESTSITVDNTPTITVDVQPLPSIIVETGVQGPQGPQGKIGRAHV